GGRDAVEVLGGVNRAVIGPSARAVEEVEAVGVSDAVDGHTISVIAVPQYQQQGRCPLALKGGLRGDSIVGTVCGDEVDERLRMLEVLHEVGPARVRLEVGVADVRVELGACAVQGRNPGVTTTRKVEHREIEWRAKEVVAQRFGHELVDLVTDGARDTAYN